MTNRLPIIDTITYGFKTLFAHFVLFLKLVAVMFAVVVVFGGIAFVSLTPSFFGALSHVHEQLKDVPYEARVGSEAGKLFIALIYGHGTILLTNLLIWIAASAVIFTGYIRFMLNVHDTGTARARELIIPSWSALRVIGAFVLVWLTIIMGAVAIGLLGLLIEVALGSMTSSPLWGFLRWANIGISGAAVVCMGIFLYVRMGFAWWAVVDKGLGPIAGIKHSFAITRGAFWRIVLLKMLIVLVGSVVKITIIGMFFVGPLMGLWYVYAYRSLEKTAPAL